MARIRFETRLPPQTVIGRLKWRTAVRYFGDWFADQRACGPDPLLEGVVADDGFVLRTRASYAPFRYAAVCHGAVRATTTGGSVVDARIRFTLGVWLPLVFSSLVTALGVFVVLGAAFSHTLSTQMLGVLGFCATGVLVLVWLLWRYRSESAAILYTLRDAAGVDED